MHKNFYTGHIISQREERKYLFLDVLIRSKLLEEHFLLSVFLVKIVQYIFHEIECLYEIYAFICI